MRPRSSTPLLTLGLLAAASGSACLLGEARVDYSAKSNAATGDNAIDLCAPIDKLDLLLMVDNSNYMAGAQQSLKNALPGMIRALTSGARRPGRKPSFPPVTDLHIGVVSSDMGVPGVDIGAQCAADGGDDGRLLHAPQAEGCDADYPSWLTFRNDDDADWLDQRNQDLACLVSLGTAGCGYEQPLESAFKALWPSEFHDDSGALITPNPFRFISTREAGTWGRGDTPEADGGNAGFLRPAREHSPSLVVVLALTDEDDCSVRSTEHLKPNDQLPDDSPHLTQEYNLRCYYNKQFLYSVAERYYSGLSWLRPGAQDRVMFAAIAGVPPDLVEADALADVDFEAADPKSRRAFFETILDDERMQEAIDPDTSSLLRPSCVRDSEDESLSSPAYPPRRLVELAKLFDKNGMVQSICQEDLAPASNAIVDMIARKLKSPCAVQSE